MTAQRSDLIILLVIQVVMVILFAVFATYSRDADARTPMKETPELDVGHIYPDYEPRADAADDRNSAQPHQGGFVQETNLRKTKYAMFQDVHVMMFVGFGFLMTFLKKYGYSSVGFNMLLAAVMIQWAMLVRGFYHHDSKDGKLHISVMTLMEADLTTATVLISMGAVLGKTTPIQLVVMGIIEVAICVSNEYVGLNVFKAIDAGASMFVHVFGAYFGLACSLAMRQGAQLADADGKTAEGASYTSDLFAMIGTIFLWLFWPSFNGSLVTGDDQHRAIINTYLALASCCVTAFAVSALVSKENKFDMVHIQNATLAGGVAIGTASDMMIQPYGALIVGMIGGALSTAGYRFLQPYLLDRIKLHDTCGVHNLHGMPGLLAGVVGALMAGIASESSYRYSLYQQFPARAPLANSTHFAEYQIHLMGTLEPGDNRTAMGQAGYQLLALTVTLVVALVTGAITGLMLNLPCIGQVPKTHWFDDEHNWEVPSLEESEKDTQHRFTGVDNPIIIETMVHG